MTFSNETVNGRPALGIRIQDNGPGLPIESQGKAFEEFFTTKTHGTGLGLAIVKRFITTHGGTIDIASDITPGFALQIVLPRTSER